MIGIRCHRLFSLLALALWASISCAQANGVTETKLTNGMTVLMKEVHAAPVFTAQVWFKVGSRNEHTGITGVSHLLEHMLFNSSKNYPKGEITDLIRERGGIENAATWTDFTYYWQLLSTDNLEFSLKTLAERVGNALLKKDEFQNERTVVLSEAEGHENDPGWLLYRGVLATAFLAHPYQWPTIGWRSDVENVDRNQLAAYYNTYYHPNNATLVLVGDFDSKNALKLIKKYFGIKPKAALPRPVYTTEPAQHGERRFEVRREGNAERVLLAYHIPDLSNPDTYPLMVLDQVLSGGRSSRLYQALVEKQLATGAWSGADIRRDPGLFTLGGTARQGVSADTIEKSLLEQVESAKSALPTSDEMQSAKNQLEAYIIFQNDSVSDQGEQLGYYNTLNSWRYLDTFIPKLKAVTPEQVQAVAKKYLVQDNLTAGWFIPTAPGPGGPNGPAGGPSHYTNLASAFSFEETSPQPSPSRRGSSSASYASRPGNDTASRSGNGAVPPPNRRGLGGGSGENVIKPYRTVLDNGMILIVQENHSNPTIAISGNMLAGSSVDSTGRRSVAPMVAEMLARGTKTRTSLELAKATDSVGASMNFSAEVESADFSAKSLTKDFGLVLELLSDQLRNASFPQDQFEKAKGEALSQLEQSKESPEGMAFRAFYGAVYPEGHPYHELTVEKSQTELQAITREDLLTFYNRYYRPDTVIMVIAGDVKAADALEIVKRHFGDWNAQGPKPQVQIPTIEPQKEPNKVEINMPDKSEVSVIYGHALGIKRSDPEFYAVRVMNQILGGGGAMGSILGDELRERQGLVYNVYSTFDAALGAGPWYAYLGTAPKNVDKAVTALKAQMNAFVTKGATQKQFMQAREFIVGSFPIALETNEGVARMLRNAEFYSLGIDYLRNYAKYYRAVTLQQVNAAAKKYLHPNAATLVLAGQIGAKK